MKFEKIFLGLVLFSGHIEADRNYQTGTGVRKAASFLVPSPATQSHTNNGNDLAEH